MVFNKFKDLICKKMTVTSTHHLIIKL